MQQQAVGALAKTLTELVIMGCSAGSIGAQLWGKQVSLIVVLCRRRGFIAYCSVEGGLIHIVV
jgi:hypothetical protein